MTPEPHLPDEIERLERVRGNIARRLQQVVREMERYRALITDELDAEISDLKLNHAQAKKDFNLTCGNNGERTDEAVAEAEKLAPHHHAAIRGIKART